MTARSHQFVLSILSVLLCFSLPLNGQDKKPPVPTFKISGELDYYIGLIHTELRNQYLIGYIPTNGAKDGKWRRIRVQVNAPPGYPKLKVRAREGYRAIDY